MNGVDHLAPQGDIGPVLQGAAELLKQRGSDISVQHVTLAHYVDAVCREVEERKPELAIKVGELREDRNGSCLAGTLSSRMYLKQRNDHSQTALTHVAERLSAFARTRGYIYPYDLMNLTWKLLMQNHPHDSICGCSIDAVHREMITRFDQVDQIADELTQRALDELCDRDQTLGVTGEEESLMVVNTLNWSRTDPVMAVLEFPLGMPARSGAECDLTRQVRGFALLDPDGQEVPFAVLKTERVLKNVLNPSELPLVQWVQRFEIEFVAEEIPGFGFKLFQVEPRDRMPQYPPMSTPADAADGVAARLCFQDTGDAGDEYLHRPPVRNGQVACPVFDGGAVHEERTAVRWSRTRSVVLPLPRESSAAARTTETVACPATVTLTRWRGVPRTEIDIEFENRACDHRLRIVWPVGRVDQVVADGAFDAVERSPRSPWEPEGGSPFQPQQWWVDATGERGDGGTGGITVINQGLPEYEMYESADGAHAVYDLGVTLLRCVGVLSGRGDGPGTATPEAQCLGRHAFRLAVVEHDDDWREARVWKQAHQFNVPFVPVHAAVPEDVPAVASYMVVEPDEAVVTAVKRAEDRDSLIVRFYNTSDAPVADACVMIPGASRVRFVNMNEEPLDEWVEGDALVFDLERKRIATVEFEL
jgi:alpha-mannosidase/mannosylglycerate hydrolase